MAGGRDFDTEFRVVLGKLRQKITREQEPGLANEIKMLAPPKTMTPQEAYLYFIEIYNNIHSDVGEHESIPDKLARIKSTRGLYRILVRKLLDINEEEFAPIAEYVKASRYAEMLNAAHRQRNADSEKYRAEVAGAAFADAMLAEEMKGGARKGKRRGGKSKKARSTKKRTARKSKH